MQTGQFGGTHCGACGVVARSRGAELGELPDQAGEGGHVEACDGELGNELGIFVPQVAAAGEEEAGEMLRGGDRPVVSIPSNWGDLLCGQLRSGVGRVVSLVVNRAAVSAHAVQAMADTWGGLASLPTPFHEKL
ncbi:hypothetical protein GCM10010207_58740 [Streptomyces atratus]|nr:hypothetical protein GCM10010207_58740 [Streptomyces atratus]